MYMLRSDDAENIPDQIIAKSTNGNFGEFVFSKKECTGSLTKVYNYSGPFGFSLRIAVMKAKDKPVSYIAHFKVVKSSIFSTGSGKGTSLEKAIEGSLEMFDSCKVYLK